MTTERNDRTKRKGLESSFNHASTLWCENGFRIAFGNQTIFLPSNRTKVEDSRLCVPTSRQVCLFGAFKDQLVDPGNQGGQTEL